LYDFIKWYDTKAQFPELKEKYWRWLGPSLDIGPAKTSRILKGNGQLIHILTFQPLNENELTDAGRFAMQLYFNNRISEVI